MEKTVRAQLKYLHISPRKARFVADLIRGMSVNNAEAQLYVNARRPAEPILKLLRSATANAKQVLKAEPSQLVIREIRVDQGPKQKRGTPRARGSMSLIEKKQCHVTIILAVSEKGTSRYTFKPKAKKNAEASKARAKTDTHEKETKETKEMKSTSREGKGPRRLFQRKSI